VLGNKVIAENWNKKETLDQKYSSIYLELKELSTTRSGSEAFDFI